MDHPRRGKAAKQRDTWANKSEFLLSCMGYAIGIGNVWRFPYLCYRSGGGAFLVPYLLMLFFCGIPLFFMETSLGQFSSTGCISVFRISPLFRGTGYAIVVVNIICTTYFNVIIAYPLLFLWYSLQSQLPWQRCNNPWNTEHCLELGDRETMNRLLYNGSTSSGLQRTTRTPADEFFHNKILQISDGIEEVGGIVWPVFAVTVLSWLVTYLCIMKGVRTVGKVVYFTATFPFVILAVLLVRGLTLPGAWTGVKFFIYPQWDQLLDLKVWADAAIQIFFSLGPGWGGLINMASFNQFHNNNLRDSILVPILNCGTSIFAGLAVFSVLGYMSHETGAPVSTVATGGPGLAFVTYPEALSLLPWPQFWSVLFFIMLFLLGLDTCFVQIEAIISSLCDAWPALQRRKFVVTLVSCMLMMCLSFAYVTNGGMYLLQLFDWYSASISVILICFIEVVIVGWTYGVDRFAKDVEFMVGERVGAHWTIAWKYITPIILCFIFVASIFFNRAITYRGLPYPTWSVTVGWCSCFTSMLCIPVYMIYLLWWRYEPSDGRRIQESLWQTIRRLIKPSEEWAPVKSEIRTAWQQFGPYSTLAKAPGFQATESTV